MRFLGLAGATLVLLLQATALFAQAEFSPEA